MSAPALRAAFWAALPSHLPLGAVVEPPARGTVGWVVVDGARIRVDASTRGKTFCVIVEGSGSPGWNPTEAPSVAASKVLKVIAQRRPSAADLAREARLAEALRLTDTAGRKPDAAPLCLVGLNYTSGALTLDPRLDFTTKQVEETFALWRRLGVLPAAPNSTGEEAPRG